MDPRPSPNETERLQSQQPTRVRIPGFITEHDLGLGEALQRITTYFHIPACDGCARRAAVLNRWMTLSGRRHK